MKGSPRSLFLSMANRAAGAWTSAATAAIKRQQRAVISETIKAATGQNRSGSRAPAVSQVAASRKNTVPPLAPRSLQNLTGQNAERHDTTLGCHLDTVEVLGSVRA